MNKEVFSLLDFHYRTLDDEARNAPVWTAVALLIDGTPGAETISDVARFSELTIGDLIRWVCVKSNLQPAEVREFLVNFLEAEVGLLDAAVDKIDNKARFWSASARLIEETPGAETIEDVMDIRRLDDRGLLRLIAEEAGLSFEGGIAVLMDDVRRVSDKGGSEAAPAG